MDPRGPLPPGVSMLPLKQRVPPPPGEDSKEVNESSPPVFSLYSKSGIKEILLSVTDLMYLLDTLFFFNLGSCLTKQKKLLIRVVLSASWLKAEIDSSSSRLTTF